MATNAHIGYIENDTITYTYLHYDSYPKHVGKVLYEEYNTTDKVKELVALGYLESIDKGEVISFHKDKGYDFNEVNPETTDSLNRFVECEFNYLFDTKTEKWRFYTNLGEFDLKTEYNNNFIRE